MGGLSFYFEKVLTAGRNKSEMKPLDEKKIDFFLDFFAEIGPKK